MMVQNCIIQKTGAKSLIRDNRFKNTNSYSTDTLVIDKNGLIKRHEIVEHGKNYANDNNWTSIKIDKDFENGIPKTTFSKYREESFCGEVTEEVKGVVIWKRYGNKRFMDFAVDKFYPKKNSSTKAVKDFFKLLVSKIK